MIMKCPVDGVLLEESRKGGLPHWACPTCQGRLIFLKTFRLALSASGAARVAGDLKGESEWPERTCANCRRPMKKIALPQKTGRPLMLASCESCAWLWFDPGEDFDTWGAEREILDRQITTLESAHRRYRYWHTFRGWGRYGFLIPWGLWALVASLMIKNHLELRNFIAAGQFGSPTERTPFAKAVFLVSALALTSMSRTRQWFVVGLILLTLAF